MVSFLLGDNYNGGVLSEVIRGLKHRAYQPLRKKRVKGGGINIAKALSQRHEHHSIVTKTICKGQRLEPQ